VRRWCVTVLMLLYISGCTFTSDEGYVRCVQGLNTVGSGIRVASGEALKVMAAGGVGSAAALVVCREPDVTESPEVLVADIPDDLSQALDEVPVTQREKSLSDAPVATAKKASFVLDSRILQFDLDGDELERGAGTTLSPVLDFLNDNPEVRVRITGHTCWLGSNEHNLDLSQRRADAVGDYLVSRGIDRDRLFVAAEGESQPIDTNLTEEGRRSNRRVEVLQL
jgi:outer membrane protein OmpA-like peptidoglycan-associated protein